MYPALMAAWASITEDPLLLGVVLVTGGTELAMIALFILGAFDALARTILTFCALLLLGVRQAFQGLPVPAVVHSRGRHVVSIEHRTVWPLVLQRRNS